jgi:hypothetical protein
MSYDYGGPEEREVTCPYCAESFSASVDPGGAGLGGDDSSSGTTVETYIEDCFVCCRPIQFTVTVSAETGEVLRVDTDRS